MPTPDQKAKVKPHYRCLKCPGEPDYVNQYVKEQHMGQCHQMDTHTDDHKGQHHDISRHQADGLFRCPTCNIGCEIANALRPHVNSCTSQANSRTSETIDTYDYSIPPAEGGDYAVKGLREASRTLKKAGNGPTAIHMPKAKNIRPHEDDGPSARERAEQLARAPLAGKFKPFKANADNAPRQAQTGNQPRPVEAKKAPSAPSLSLSFKKKDPVPPGSTPARVDAAPAPGPSVPRPSHAPVSAIASGSSQPQRARSGSPPISRPPQKSHQQHAEDRRRSTGSNATGFGRPPREPVQSRPSSRDAYDQEDPINSFPPAYPAQRAVHIQPAWGHVQQPQPYIPPAAPHQEPERTSNLPECTLAVVSSGLPSFSPNFSSKGAKVPSKSILKRIAPLPGAQPSGSTPQQQSVAPADTGPSSPNEPALPVSGWQGEVVVGLNQFAVSQMACENPRFEALYGGPREVPAGSAREAKNLRRSIKRVIKSLDKPPNPAGIRYSWPPSTSPPKASAPELAAGEAPQSRLSPPGIEGWAPSAVGPPDAPQSQPSSQQQQQQQQPPQPQSNVVSQSQQPDALSRPVQAQPAPVQPAGSVLGDNNGVARLVVPAPAPASVAPYVRPTDPRKRAREDDDVAGEAANKLLKKQPGFEIFIERPYA